jgi:sugar phosphate isomerase/epimerase|tara:strand:- start:313 stop:1212 length:900 start_codon:yes stop_codon:yes gene_type:complete
MDTLMKIKLLILIVSGLVLCSCLATAKNELDNIFYCQNTMWDFDNRPETPLQKAKLMKAIGFDGLEGFGYTNFFELKKELTKEGLSMPVNYVKIDFGVDGKLNGNALNEIKEMIKGSEKGAIVYFALIGRYFIDTEESGEEMVVPVLREFSDYAISFGVKLCIYPHVTFYCETIAHSVKIAKMVDRKNFGAALNLCHLLKVEGIEELDTKIETYTPWLFAVNISGADIGDTKEFGWDRLIQPLGQGSFDTYAFVKSLKDHGYDGPFGIQVYNLKGDVVETLTKTKEVWEGYKRRYAQEN